MWNKIECENMNEFKELWEDVLKTIVFPTGYLKNRVETLNDQTLISKAYQYCIIMRTKEGLTEYLNYHGSDTDFFMNKITELLDLQSLNKEERNIIIRNYLKQNIIDNGFVCHTTNSISAENIMINGFTYKQTEEHTQDIIGELKKIFPEGFFKTDLNYIEGQKERKGWFYDRSPYHYKRYSNGPEWLKRLVNSGNYTRRDYEGAKRFISQMMDMYDEPEEKKTKALAFVEKYWKIYTKTTPHMLLVSTKDKDLRDPREAEIVENFSPEDQIRYYIELYFKGTDKNTTEEIRPSNIIDIDMTELEKLMTDSYTM